MAYGKNLYTLVEFGTDKICVLSGTCSDGNPEIVSFVQKSSAGSVVKGSVEDYNTALKILREALEISDKISGFSGDRKKVYYLLSGTSVTSFQGEGSVLIDSPDRKVNEKHINDAAAEAQKAVFSADLCNVNSFDAYFMLDRRKRVADPYGAIAERLDACLHIISAEKKQLENINAIFRELGFENGGEPVFSGIASAFGALNNDEREKGVFLVDFGAGCCDYIMICNDGVLLSGVLPVGVHHIANDLSIGLNLPFDVCLRFLKESALENLRKNGQSFMEYKDGAGRARRIPLDSFEKIIDMRIREVFTILRGYLEKAKLLSYINTGVVLCGGGAVIPASQEIAHDVFRTHVRIGEAAGFTGAMSAFEYPAPCYTAIQGLLRYAAEYEDEYPSAMDGFRNAIVGLGERFLSKFGKAK